MKYGLGAFALAIAAASSAPSPLFPEDARFFAKVHVNIVASAPSFGSFYNSTAFWVRDEVGQRERLDQSTNTRFLTFSPQFGSTLESTVTANDTVFSANVASSTCSITSLSEEDSTEADRGFPGSAAVGSMRRFLPDTTNEMGTNPKSWVTTTNNDSFIGYETIETPYTNGKANTTVWGWEDVWSNGLVFASHHVYVSVDTGLPLKEVQMEHATSYPPQLEAVFEYDDVESYDNWESYFDDGKYGAGLQIFGRPGACQPSSAFGQCGGSEWNGSTECAEGASCTFVNEWYSQCLPKS